MSDVNQSETKPVAWTRKCISGRRKRFPRHTVLLSARTAVAMLFLCCFQDIALAGGQECMAIYYRAKPPACVDQVLADLRKTPPESREPTTVIGFLAQLFQDSSQERERILKAETSAYVRTVDLVALYRAGLADDAQKFVAANNLSAVSERVHAMRLTTLDAVKPYSIPGDNDLLIGAYMASGNIVIIKRILDNYSSADDAMVHDGLRIGFMMSKFGPGLAPKGRDAVTIQAACARYQCRTDQTKLLRVMTLATAIWSLQSLSEQDDKIKKAMSDFLASDPRLKTLFSIEQAAFSNYVTAVIVTTTLKDDHGRPEQAQAYAAMSRSASIYENLGSADEAFTPMTGLKN